MDNDKPTVAIVYDFDGTLAKGNVQENSFLPEIGISKNDFWSGVKQKTKEQDADEILVYMQEMLRVAKDSGNEVTKDKLREHGRSAQLFSGLGDGTWFERIKKDSERYKLNIKHFIVSSGTYEMISSCLISKYFDKIFASKFIFENDRAVWPGLAINYTSKTQFLFRINKGVDNIWDNERVNAYMPLDERPIPFKRMIFIGDGDTDIPSMKMTTYQGGHAIAVYDPGRQISDIRKISRLISDGRADFVAPADYTENSQLDIIVRGILGRIARNNGYRPESGSCSPKS